MGSDLHFLTNALLIVVCALMGTSFLSIHIPKKEGLKNYRISLKVLSGAYFLMGILTVLVLAFNLSDNSREHFTFIAILISSTQALLFTFTLITLINPNFVKLKSLLKHLVPYILFTALYAISNAVYDDPKLASLKDVDQYINNPTIWVRILFLAYYAFQLIYYTFLFISEERKYTAEILDYFSEVVELKMRWVKIAYYSALSVGTFAMIANFFPKQFDWIATLVFSIFYFGYAQEYIKYHKFYTIIEPALKTPLVEASISQPRIVIKTDWKHFKQKVLSQKYYCEPGITIEDIANKLNIGRTTLSNMINREEGVNFNAWINRLRIEDAKQMLIEKPEYSIAIISELVGYTEQANFSRQFKQIAGETPLLWRKNSAS
jgi:AraC-like DNA-binding protein